MLLRRDVLVAEEDHEVFGQRAVDLVDLAVGARVVGNQLADSDARDLRADNRRQLLDPDGLVRLDFGGGLPIARTLLAGKRRHGRFSGEGFYSGHRSPDGAKRNPGSAYRLGRQPGFRWCSIRATAAFVVPALR